MYLINFYNNQGKLTWHLALKGTIEQAQKAAHKYSQIKLFTRGTIIIEEV